jgi:hypothetical protein
MIIFWGVTNFDVGGHQPNIKVDDLNITKLRIGNINIIN